MGLTGLTAGYQLGTFLLEALGELISLPFPASRSCLHFWACSSHLSSKPAMAGQVLLTLHRSLPLNYTFKHPSNYNGPAQTVQAKLPFSRSGDQQPNSICNLNSPLLYNVTQSHSGDQNVDILRRRYSAYHSHPSQQVTSSEPLFPHTELITVPTSESSSED